LLRGAVGFCGPATPSKPSLMHPLLPACVLNPSLGLSLPCRLAVGFRHTHMHCGPDCCCWCRCVLASHAWAGERPAGTLGSISGIKALSPTAATASHSWLCVCLCVCFGRFGAPAHLELSAVYVLGTWAARWHPRRSASAAAVADVAGSHCWPACTAMAASICRLSCQCYSLRGDLAPPSAAQRSTAQHSTGQPAAATSTACGRLLRRRRAVCRCCWVAVQALSFTQVYACSGRSMLAAACAATQHQQTGPAGTVQRIGLSTVPDFFCQDSFCQDRLCPDSGASCWGVLVSAA
jgi:hypothetical protein